MPMNNVFLNIKEDVLKDIILMRMMRVEDVFQIVKNVQKGTL
jgi:hypothetical protein